MFLHSTAMNNLMSMSQALLRFSILCALSAIIFSSCAQEHHADFLKYVDEQNEHYANPEESPLKEKAANFESLEYYDFNPEMIVVAIWMPQKGNKPFKMATSTDRKPTYVKVGEFKFIIEGSAQTLSAYQNVDYVAENPEAAEDLFVPFNDMTNGVTTYGGGRYMDVKIPSEAQVSLDFNKTYNPYCAYDHAYSCPIPPDENMLDVSIPAGVKTGINMGN